MVELPMHQRSGWIKTLRAGAVATIITALAGLVHEAGVVFDHYLDVSERRYEVDHGVRILPPMLTDTQQ